MVATSNPAKVVEIEQILSGHSIRLITRAELSGWPEIAETGSTYLENALIKARAVADRVGRPALADDSGIEVDVLDGGPGPRSARLAGEGATDEQNNVRLISLLFGVLPERRTARYRCVAVIVFPDGGEVVAEGVCEGTIALEARGLGGFGYDPWFIPAGEARTMAELSPAEKHGISHRGRALRALMQRLQELEEAGGG